MTQLLKISDEKDVIDSFKDEWAEFSNFYPCKIIFQGIEFPSVEHAYVASKSESPMFWRKISEIPANEAGKTKKLGRSIKLRSDWEIVKIALMRRFLTQKFNQSPFKEKLLSTGDAILIEGNYWHDNIWGDCKCPKCKNIKGKNYLGGLLMKIREEVS